MFLAFLNNYDIRPVTAQYLWVFYCMLHRLGREDVAFVLNEEYVKQYSPEDRWEMKREIAAKNFYIPPETLEFEEIRYFVGEKVVISDNPSKNLRHYIKGYDPAILGNIDFTGVKAGLTWVNNKTFEEKCRQNNIPIIHNEFAVLRTPVYKDTFYFDFSGVNGNTEFRKRFEEFKKKVNRNLLLSVEELIRLAAKSEFACTLIDIYKNRGERQYKCGVPLQVMNDTNAIAYSNGWSNIDLLSYAIKKYGRGTTLLRNHPACVFRATDRPCDRFDGGNCFEFIDKVDHIATINSSVGFEAVLLGKTVEYLGESPFDIVNSLPAEDLLPFLNFTIINYIVPNRFLFDKEYYLYRLECFDENELFRVGLENWKNS